MLRISMRRIEVSRPSSRFIVPTWAPSPTLIALDVEGVELRERCVTKERDEMDLQATALHNEIFAAFFAKMLQILGGGLTKAQGDLPPHREIEPSLACL
jgi:hypothetical protein